MLAFVKAFFLDLDLYYYTHPKQTFTGGRIDPKKEGRKGWKERGTL